MRRAAEGPARTGAGDRCRTDAERSAPAGVATIVRGTVDDATRAWRRRRAHGGTAAADGTGRGARDRGVRDRHEPRLPRQGVRRPASPDRPAGAGEGQEIAAIKALDDRSKQLLDPGFIKRQGRERLFYCDPGQKCYVVMGESPSSGRGTTGERKAVARPPWYETLWDSVKAADSGGGQKAAKAAG